MYLSLCLTVAIGIDNIHYFSGFIRSFNLLKVLLKDVCNISDNKFALQIRKNIHIFLDVLFSGLYFFRYPLHAVPLTTSF